MSYKLINEYFATVLTFTKNNRQNLLRKNKKATNKSG